MILSTPTENATAKLGDERAVELIADAGFDAVDYSMFLMQNDDNVLNTPNYEKHVLNVKSIAENNGVFFNQAHAPFPSYRPGYESYNVKIYDRIKRSIEVAGILGVKNIVVHPTYYQSNSEENLKRNCEFYNSLIPYCKEYSVKIAVENMFGWDDRRIILLPTSAACLMNSAK